MRIFRHPRRSVVNAGRRLSAQRRTQQLRLLQEASHQIVAALEVPTVLGRLVDAIQRTMGYQHVAAGLIEDGCLVFRDTAAAPDVPRVVEVVRLPLDGPGLTTWAARHAEPVLVEDVAVDSRYLLVGNLSMTRSELAIPLIGRAGVIGVIDMESDRPRGFDCNDLSLMRTLAEHAATAIENAQLYQAEQQHRRELEALQGIALKLGGDLDLDTVLRTVVESATSVLAADAASILMPDPISDVLTVRSHHNLPEVYAEKLRVPGREIEELIERWGSAGALELPFAAGDQVITADAAAIVGFVSVATCRLLVEGAFIGALCIYCRTPRRLAVSERRMLGALGQQAALAISGARRYQHERLLVADLERSYDELQRTFSELQQAQEQLMRTARLRALGELASGVAHDFNNLLSGVLGNVQLLLLDESDPERQHMLGVIEQAALDGAAVVRRIQEFARQREDRTRELVDLAAVIASALAITRTHWHDMARRDGRPIAIRREIRHAAMTIGNPTELRELLINLIINAVDAMPQGGALTLRLDKPPTSTPFDRQHATIEVSDTGVGIPPEIQQRIFESFFTTKPAGQGSGLGLAICQNIVTRHAGQIQLSSTPGQGTTFRVLLPLNEAPPAARPAPAAPAPVAACRVLVVDDEPAVRDVLARILQRAGHTVTTAASGEETLEHFAPGQYDLLFTNLGLPGMSGAMLLRRLRACDPRLIAVVVTGWSQQGDPGEALPGAAAVIVKPFSAARITELVGELIGARA
jgi:signal transduction histidine kinase/CheY-like chemotaxis protein